MECYQTGLKIYKKNSLKKLLMHNQQNQYRHLVLTLWCQGQEKKGKKRRIKENIFQKSGNFHNFTKEKEVAKVQPTMTDHGEINK